MKKAAAAILLLTLIVIWLWYKVPAEKPAGNLGPSVTVWLKKENKIVRMPMETYLVGVVAAEMPSGFQTEALKAQAVCARTYAFRRLAEKEKHPNGAVLCDDYTHCQAYRRVAGSALEGPMEYVRIRKVASAVTATKGETLTYHGVLIDCPYHSTCGGRTASAEEVWHTAVPYLVSVRCPCGRISPHAKKSVVFNNKAIARALGIRKWKPHIAERSRTGRVEKVTSAGTVVSGIMIRSTLNLPSRMFEIKTDGSNTVFITRGYGHGVGMCQYGAETLAKDGSDYREILDHYYRDVRLKRIRY